MRLFTALDLPGDVTQELEALLLRLRPKAKINWSPPANLHITTKFIGEWPEARLDELVSKLGQLPPRNPLDVRVGGVGFFPNAKSPRVFWCGVEAAGLDALATDTDAATTTLGVPSEKRAYYPHLTLARIKDQLNLTPLHDAVAAEPTLEFGRFEARSFFLYLSKLKPAGSVYTKLAEFPLSPL